MDQNIKKRLVWLSGITMFLYYFIPVIQHHVFIERVAKANDYFIFYFPLQVFQSLLIISYGTILPYLIQVLLFLISWFFIYFILKLFHNKLNV